MARRLLAHGAPYGLGLKGSQCLIPSVFEAALSWPHCAREAADHSVVRNSKDRSTWESSHAFRGYQPLTRECAGPWSYAQWRRAFQTAGGAGLQSPDRKLADVQAFMEGLGATKLRQELTLEADDRPFMQYKELVQFILKSGAAPTDAAAQELASALVRGGVVLRLGDTVYLKPHEVAALVYRAVPSDPSIARQRLAEVEAELQELERKRQAVAAAARRWPRFWVNFGCAAAVGQVFLMAYLTWWELSWDVMEPVAYHLTLTWGAFAYIYFLAMRGRTQLDYPDFTEYWYNVQEAKKRAEAGFDHGKYQHLSMVRENYERYLQAAAVAGQSPAPSGSHQAVAGSTREPRAAELGARGKAE